MSVPLGFGLYYHMLNDSHMRFAKQCAATHVVTHLVDYFHQGQQGKQDNQPIGDHSGWGKAGAHPEVWELPYLQQLRDKIESHGLIWHAVENFDPAHWYDVLLAGPQRDEQLEFLQKIIRNLARVGVKVLGYNFSLAGVSSRITGNFARGSAQSVGMDGTVDDRPIPQGMIWNMVYDEELLQSGAYHPSIDHQELWKRLEYFLKALLPVAEEVGIKLAAHPDDPPTQWLRQQPRLVYQPELYQRLIDLDSSPSNTLEICLGTLQEMPGTDVVEYLERYIKQDRVAYAHLRNVRGHCPNYKEVFIDEGDLKVKKIMPLLHEKSILIIPDHCPSMESPAPWHTGMAFSMGYLKAHQEGVNHD